MVAAARSIDRAAPRGRRRMIGRCEKCKATLGPWDADDRCLSCEENHWRRWSVSDRAIATLERAKLPLYRWDICRELGREGHSVNESTMGTSLADDMRACWAGPGLYGLYRHGLLPGIRDIGAAAATYIHASDRSLRVDEVRFVLHHAGYRFSANSLPPALGRTA